VRGTAIHKALELFEDEAQDKSPAALLELLETVLLEGGEGEADLISLRARRLEVCEEYTDWRAAHKDRIEGKPILEERGSIPHRKARRRQGGYPGLQVRKTAQREASSLRPDAANAPARPDRA